MPRRLPPLPSVGDIIKLYGLKAKSQLSQNFLLDLNITDKIVRVAGGVSGHCVCEIGPGPGALTRSLLNADVEKLVVVEKDLRFCPSLELLQDASDQRLEVHFGDALNFKIEQACGPYATRTNWEDAPNFHVVGNLPFNISLPLLLQWLSMIASKSGPFHFGRSQLTLTFQKEVAEVGGYIHESGERMPECDSELMLQVDAVVLKLTPLIVPKISAHYDTVEKVVKTLFHHRRKFIRKGAMMLFADHKDQNDLVEELFMQSGVEETLRAQQLTMEHFNQLCIIYEALCSSLNSNRNTDSK